MMGNISDLPLPRFTIEELLREAVEATPTDERCVFTMKELAALWGCRSLRTARSQQDVLKESGWRFEPTMKQAVNRAGILTQVIAYIVMPPDSYTDDADNADNADGANDSIKDREARR